jgi:UDP-N-acetylglucosamine 2-epimerase (non-hydrolysing)
MLAAVERVLLDERPDAVLVQGDTNSVLAGAIAASKTDADLGHVEAGLRSFDREMPEEINRVLADHASDYLFAPTEQSERLLREEGILDDRIFVTGNTIVDAVEDNRELAARKSTVLDDHALHPNEFCLMTAHRPQNVDDPERFADILEGIGRFASDAGLDAIYPIHPRAEKQLREHDLRVPDAVSLIEPKDFLDFVRLESEAKLVITDSGGVQEETCILGTPCVTVRDSTERPETIDVGANRLVGSDPERIVEGAREMSAATIDWENPFGDGTAAERILEIVRERAY